MLCPNCETENRDGAKFCDECGFPLKGVSAQPAQEQPESHAVEQSDATFEPKPSTFEEAASSEGFGAAAGQLESDSLAEEQASAREDEGSVGEQEQALEADGAEAIGDVAPQKTDRDDAQTEDGLNEAPDGGAPSSDTASTEPERETGDDVTGYFNVDLTGFDRHSAEFGEHPLTHTHNTQKMELDDIEGAEQEEDETKRKRKEYLSSSSVKKKGYGKIVALGIIAAAFLICGCAFATYHMQIWGGKVVPDVTGMTEADAKSVIVDAGFTVRSTKVKSDDTEGLVLIVDPTPNSRADEGSEVVIHISTARTIPDIVGKKQADASVALAEAGYENVTFKNKSSEKKKGTVLSTDPKAGERAKSSAEVVVEVAAPYVVPDISTLTLDKAIKAIEDAGLGYEVVNVPTSEYNDGAIIGTEPAANTEVEKGTYVVINVAQARGPHLEELAMAYLSPGQTLQLASGNYEIISCDAVSYSADNTVAYTVTVREYGSMFGITVHKPETDTINGTITFTANDEIASVS